MLGDLDGDIDAEGDNDGLLEGLMLGLKLADGLKLGLTEGETLGLTDGEILGDMDALMFPPTALWRQRRSRLDSIQSYNQLYIEYPGPHSCQHILHCRCKTEHPKAWSHRQRFFVGLWCRPMTRIGREKKGRSISPNL